MTQQTYTTRITNHQVSATLLGLVVDDIAYNEKIVHYASLIGPQASLKSIWATLVSRRKATLEVSSSRAYNKDGEYQGLAFRYYWGLKGGKGLKSFWTPLPGTAWQHMVAVSQDVLKGDIVLVTNPEGVFRAGDERKELLAEAEDEFLRRFVATLNAATEVPVLPEWGKAVFTHAVRLPYGEEWVQRLEAFGDAIVAYRVNATTQNTLTMVSRVLGKGVAQ